MSVTSISQNLQGVGQLPSAALGVIGRLQTGSFRANLKPASYRNFPFFVLGGDASFGRRNAVHEYPFRDTPWVEDLGRKYRKIDVRGYIVGDDVIAQRDRLLALVETAGEGDLVHPTLGKRVVALMDFTCNEQWDRGRVFEISFGFIEQGARIFPSATPAPSATTAAAAAATNSAAAASFVNRTLDALQQGATVAAAAAERASEYAARAEAAVRDATSLIVLAVGLPGEFGRLLKQSSGLDPRTVLAPVRSATLASLSAAATASRQAVSAAADNLRGAGAALGAGTAEAVALRSQDLVVATVSAAPSPGESIRALLKLASDSAAPVVTGAAVTVQVATSDVLRRAALSALATVASGYVPASADEALSVRNQVVDVLDAEITLAGDQAEDDVYATLRALRAAATAALNAAGAQAPELVTVRTGAPLPALVLAQRLYRDPGRLGDVLAYANPVHPAFMPTTFRALAT